ncbi:MAG: Tfp pilus assembly protein FimT/FimU, partial [Clostridia bacterium]
MTKEKQKNKGITLIALVVTIVVLLILAGITITALFGD